jgi:(p)ppGpp synthase/HD superfamily hydrolase
LLHDAVEDQGVTDAEIADLFGPTAASLVAEVTDDKNLPKQVRKDKQIAGASHKSDGASVIKLADKTSGAVTRTEFGPGEDWKAQFELRPRWRLAAYGRLPLRRRGACGGTLDGVGR